MKPMSTLRKILIAFAEKTVFILIISLAFYTSQPIQTTKTLLVPSGSISHIITQLSQKGYALSPIDKYLLVFMGQPQSGWVELTATKLNRIDFLYQLSTAKAKMEEITLIPGETLEIFLNQVAHLLKLDINLLKNYYTTLSQYPEAGIYADTYYIPFGITEKHLIYFLLSRSQEKYKLISEKIYGTYNPKQWINILTIASIIQKEAANEKEMPLVASVIYNRLKKEMPLQMDGTLNYGKYSHIKVSAYRIRNDESRFNTYKYKGLPPSPIGAVSFPAILAAIKPAQTNYLYFMKNKQGVHDFTDNYATHQKNIQNAR